MGRETKRQFQFLSAEVSLASCTTTVIKTLQHLHFLLVVGTAENLTSLDDELVALLQLASADDANETTQVKDVIRCPVDKLVGVDLVTARQAFVFGVDPEISLMWVTTGFN